MPSTQQPIGRMLVLHKGAYSGSTQYEFLDEVSYQGSTYRYINQTASSGHAPTDTNYWVLVAQKGVDGEVTEAELAAALAPIEAKIPSGASTSNKLATASDVNDVWTANGVLGAKNFLYTDENTKTYEGVTYTVNRDTKGNITSIDVSGTPTAYSSIAFWADIKPDIYKISHMENAANFVWGEITLYKNGSQVQELPALGTADDTVIDLRSYDFDKFKITAKRVSNSVATTATIYPMLRLATDTDSTYQPYAMTNRELTERLVKDAIHQTVTEKGLGFNFMRKDNIVLVEFVGEATEAIANDAKIIDIPSDYTMAINEHAFALYKNNISGGAVGMITIKSNAIYANTPISIGDKPRGSFTFAH